MKGTDRIILVALPIVALVVGFYMLVLSPKMKESGELDDRIETAEAGIATAEASVAVGEQARKAFSGNYADLVGLGAAAPENEDQSSLINDFTDLGRAASVSFRSFAVVPGTGGTAAPPPTTVTAPSATEPTSAEPVAETAALPTEAAAAALPVGATVGSAGLPVTPYSLTYFGEFFDMADLFASLDGRVDVRKLGEPADVEGRLITIDGFNMSADPVDGFPRVKTDLAITSYLVPAEQGISAGATPAGPAPVGSPDEPVPVSADPAAAAPATASVAP